MLLSQETARTLRRQALLTQEDLARVAGVSKATVQNFEAGRSMPRFSTLQALAAALGCEVAPVPDGACPAGTSLPAGDARGEVRPELLGEDSDGRTTSTPEQVA